MVCITNLQKFSRIKEPPFCYVHGFCGILGETSLWFIMSGTPNAKTQITGNSHNGGGANYPAALSLIYVVSEQG